MMHGQKNIKSMDQLRKMVRGDGGLIMNCIKYIMNQK